MSIMTLKLPNNNYNIYINEGIFKNIASMLAKWYQGNTIAVITDSNVNLLYGNSLTAALETEGWSVYKLVISSGEASKSIDTLEWLYNQLSENYIDRSSLIIAFGGGVVGDIAGFTAATYLRGVPYIQLPTTLMSQLDSSIGGKTAINLRVGKNLAGCFYQPRAVYIYTELLESLSDKLFCDGLAEAVKYAAIKDTFIYKLILQAGSLSKLRLLAEQIITPCCNIKKELVQADEHDTCDRLILNFGHTIGHGIEKYYNFSRYTHGEAVAIGMQHITSISENLGLTNKGTHQELLELLKICTLPCSLPELNKNMLLDIIKHDKKSSHTSFHIILLKALGQAYIYTVPNEDLMRFI